MDAEMEAVEAALARDEAEAVDEFEAFELALARDEDEEI